LSLLNDEDLFKELYIGDEIYDDVEELKSKEKSKRDMTDEVDDKDRYIFDNEYYYI